MEVCSLPALLSFLLPLIIPTLLILILYSSPINPWRKRRPSEVDDDPAASFKPYPILGHLPHFLKHRHRILDWQTELLAASPTNTIFLRRPGNVRGVITANPANVEHVLKTHFDNYPKGPRFTTTLHDFLGRGIFNSDGDQWRAQRKTASFEFNTRSLRTFVVHNVQREIRSRLLPLLRRTAVSGAILDLQDVFERFAFDNVCRVAFNEDPACLDDDDEGETAAAAAAEGGSGFAAAFRDATSISAARFRYAVPGIWRVKKLLGVGSERRLRESISTVHGFATGIIRSRKKEIKESSPSHHQDLLSRFVAGEDSSDEFLRDIVISFILAGRETTSSALTWFFWLLSSRPEVERRILEEIRTVRANRGGGRGEEEEEAEEETLGFEELREMHYLHAALTESMRLYPPVPSNATWCRKDDVLPDGTLVGKDWFVSYNAYAMGRMTGVWGEDCLEYRPERWLDEAGQFRAESPFRYPAFHAGPRICLGKEMAYIQMKSIAACVIQRFTVEVVGRDGTCPEKVLALTLRMKGGLLVRVRERAAH